jgi:hypothetical protein
MRGMGWFAWLFAAIVVAALMLAGCAGSSESSDSDDGQDASTETDSGDEASADIEMGEGDVLMMGRSVMAGWFEHWDSEWDWESPIEENGYTLAYGGLSEPPEIAQSACQYIAEAPEGSVAFFKFCFVDCYGSSGQEGEDELADLEMWTEEVAACASDSGVTLIVGNALPQVADHTSADLVAQHRAYNEWLDGFAESNDGIYVFDQYGVLTDADGNLKAEYAVSPEDSHLNDEAYQALDPDLFQLLAAAQEQ